MSIVDFPTWFSAGCYGGLACCMLTIAADALFSAWRRRGTTQQLAGAIVISVASALLLLPALLWYHLRFVPAQATITLAEVQLALVYIVVCGWLLPLGITTAYCLFTLPRTSINSERLPSQRSKRAAKRTTRANDAAAGPRPPRHQPGMPVPYVFSEDTPWGWLEYRSGNFRGQRLELKRAIITIGRDEDNDIWIDDDMASRHHAELAYDQGKTYVTDCDSLNGVLLNGRRIHGSVEMEPGELLEIGSQRFAFVPTQPRTQASDEEDPLIHHRWRSSLESLTGSFPPVVSPATTPTTPGETPALPRRPGQVTSEPGLPALPLINSAWQDTASLGKSAQASSPTQSGVLLICDGPMTGTCFLLDQPVITLGRGTECDVLINDASISRQHAQFLRQVQGDYVQDLTSRNGTKVNNEGLTGPRLLVSGDVISIGVITLQYSAVQSALTAPLPLILTPRPALKPISGPVPLRLPSRPRP